MKRSDFNFLIDALAFLGLVLLVSTGFVMRFVLPPLREEAGPSLLWGMDRHQWGEIHFWIAAGLLVIMVVHLFLHWKWIVSVVQGKPREGSGIRASLGILSLIVLLGAALSPFFSPTEQKIRRGKPIFSEKRQEKSIEDKIPVHKSPENQVDSDQNKVTEVEKPDSKKESHAKGILGRMNLREIEETTGVPVAYVLKKLGLPGDTDSENRLGRLGKQYEFDMQVVREIVDNYQREKSSISQIAK